MSLFTDDLTLACRKWQEVHQKLLKQSLMGSQDTRQRYTYTSNKQPENKIKKIVPFTIASKAEDTQLNF